MLVLSSVCVTTCVFPFPEGYFCAARVPAFSLLFTPRSIQELMGFTANSQADHGSLITAGKGKGKLSCSIIPLVYFIICFKRVTMGQPVCLFLSSSRFRGGKK
ncbi:hypothetical protein GOODEAATRI_006126 [Goodea atripinnis]|uniref:Secreted protein n=1 Tax=Goodea atripinnis TaxID=208336 RepID=A0ABV0PBS1_9TELE